MKILHISDTHNRHKHIPHDFYAKENYPDVIVFSGDMSSVGHKHEIEAFLEWFIKLPAIEKVLVAGNHDISFDNKKGQARQEWLNGVLEEYGEGHEFYYLENSSVEIQGVKFWGSPITPWFHGNTWAFNKQRGKDIQDIWDTIPKDTQVLITHGPAYGRLDYVNQDREAVGCQDLLDKIRSVKPLLHLCGHVHEGHGVYTDDMTTFFNGAICNLSYNPINKPHLIEADFATKEVTIKTT